MAIWPLAVDRRIWRGLGGKAGKTGFGAGLADYGPLERGMAGKPSRRSRGDRRQTHVLTQAKRERIIDGI